MLYASAISMMAGLLALVGAISTGELLIAMVMAWGFALILVKLDQISGPGHDAGGR